jgi:hypothetical protein
MNTFDTDGILAGLEAYLDELPAKRRGRRTRAEIDADYDITPEAENYPTAPEGGAPVLDIDGTEALAQLVLLARRIDRALPKTGGGYMRSVRDEILDIIKSNTTEAGLGTILARVDALEGGAK